MKLKIVLFFIATFLAFICSGETYSQNAVQETQGAAGSGASSGETPDQAKQAEESKKEEIKAEETKEKSAVTEEEAGNTPTEEANKNANENAVENVEEEQPENDNVWDTDTINKRQGWRSQEERIQRGLGDEDMIKY
jgi:hypothetical protein